MQQTIFTWKYIHDGTEVQQLQYGAFVDGTNFGFSSNCLDAGASQLSSFTTGRGDGNRTVVLDVNGGTGFFGQRTNDCATLTNHVTDFFRIDLHGVQTWCEGRNFGTCFAHRTLHQAEDMQTGFTGLGQCNLHDFLGNALDLDVHLQCSDTVFSTGYLEVHIAEVIFITQDIGQNSETTTVLDQAHGDTCHVILQWYTSVHHGQTAATDRSHRRRTVRFGNFRNHTHGVAEIFWCWQNRNQSALGQTTMAEFTALGTTHTTAFASGVRRHVVMEQEAVFVLTHQGVNDLLVTASTQRGNNQRLCFTTSKQ